MGRSSRGVGVEGVLSMIDFISVFFYREGGGRENKIVSRVMVVRMVVGIGKKVLGIYLM